MTIDEALQQAVDHHTRGRLGEAEQIYRLVLGQRPDHAHANQLLGLAIAQRGEFLQALPWLQRAIALCPQAAEYRYNLGRVLQSAERRNEAAEAYAAAIKLDPKHVNAHLNLGHLHALRQELPAAARQFQQAIALEPGNVAAHNNLGIVLKDLGRLAEAAAALETAVRLQPDFAEAHNNLGIVRQELHDYAGAAAEFERATKLQPDSAEAHNNLGVVWTKLGRFEAAIAAGREATRLAPTSAAAWHGLAAAILESGQATDALVPFQTALRLRPGDPTLLVQFSATLQRAGRMDEAVAAAREALTHDPESAEAHRTLGNALRECGELDPAIDHYRTAVRLRPGHAPYRSNLLFALHYHPAYDARALLREHREWAATLAPVVKGAPPLRRPHQRLRVGYVSADFHDHPVGRNIYPLLSRHDRERFEIFAYAQNVREDAFTARLHAFTDHWRRISPLTDERAAELIQRDEIDVLVDLSLHTAGNRLPLFARKPAPVQITFAGYPGTTGLAEIDYRLTDPHLDPPGTRDELYAERSWRLPHSFWCFDPIDDRPVYAPLPVAENSPIVWGCFNNPCKLTTVTLEWWAEILVRVPHSRLLMLAHAAADERRVTAALSQRGVDPGRLEFVGRAPRPHYLELHNRCHAILDTFPYNGHTTTCDALWMGVPVVTLAGTTAVSRGGLSLLTNIGLRELVAERPEDFVARAVALALDRDRLRRIRADLRGQMERSPLMDGNGFARAIEQAFRTMWERHLDSQGRADLFRP